MFFGIKHRPIACDVMGRAYNIIKKIDLILSFVGYFLTNHYTIYNEKYFSDDRFSYIVCVLTWRA